MELNKIVIQILVLSLWSAVTSGDVYNNNLVVSHREDFIANPMADIIATGMQLALKHCQHQFKHQPWNCPIEDFIAKQQNPTMDRESAFVQSLSVAAIAYTVAKNCSKEKNSFCGCAFKENNGVDDVYDCLMNIENTENELTHIISKLSGDRSAYDPQGVMLMQNSRAALFAVMNSVQKTCRCHGFSGSCSISTCWMALDSFTKIASEIYTLYLFAEPLEAKNSMNMEHFEITDSEMVYLNDSPNYCGSSKGAKNKFLWESVRGRKCATSQSTDEERANCRNLCMDCGLRMKWREVMTKRSCNCKFQWCCNVTCDVCEEPIKEFYCS